MNCLITIWALLCKGSQYAALLGQCCAIKHGFNTLMGNPSACWLASCTASLSIGLCTEGEDDGGIDINQFAQVATGMFSWCNAHQLIPIGNKEKHHDAESKSTCMHSTRCELVHCRDGSRHFAGLITVLPGAHMGKNVNAVMLAGGMSSAQPSHATRRTSKCHYPSLLFSQLNLLLPGRPFA